MSRMVRKAVELAATFAAIMGLMVLTEWLRAVGGEVKAPDWRLVIAAAIPAALLMMARFKR